MGAPGGRAVAEKAVGKEEVMAAVGKEEVLAAAMEVAVRAAAMEVVARAAVESMWPSLNFPSPVPRKMRLARRAARRTCR